MPTAATGSQLAWCHRREVLPPEKRYEAYCSDGGYHTLRRSVRADRIGVADGAHGRSHEKRSGFIGRPHPTRASPGSRASASARACSCPSKFGGRTPAGDDQPESGSLQWPADHRRRKLPRSREHLVLRTGAARDRRCRDHGHRTRRLVRWRSHLAFKPGHPDRGQRIDDDSHAVVQCILVRPYSADEFRRYRCGRQELERHGDDGAPVGQINPEPGFTLAAWLPERESRALRDFFWLLPRSQTRGRLTSTASLSVCMTVLASIHARLPAHSRSLGKLSGPRRSTSSGPRVFPDARTPPAIARSAALRPAYRTHARSASPRALRRSATRWST